MPARIGRWDVLSCWVLRVRFQVLICASAALAAAPALSAQTHHKFQKKPDPVVQEPATPPAPLTPAQMPATPPNVAYNGGQLTISAPNSTLGDILREVRKQTGATVDIPGNATERVMGTFGPGPARDVLASLLNGSHFNYVILGSATNPASLDRVMLLSKPAADAAAQPVNTAQAQNPGAPAGGAQPEAMEFGNEESAEQQQDSVDIFGGANNDDQANQAQADDQQGQANPFAAPNNGVKTPEQLLQELQQRQQQGLPAGPGVPNPGGRFNGTVPPAGAPQNPNPQQE